MKRKLHLIFSLDYELFGNASGDINKNLFTPTDRLLALCKETGLKLSVFPDFSEIHSYHQLATTGNSICNAAYNGIFSNLSNARNQGHDIHFHMHPQWYKAIFANGKWSIDFQYWRIHNLIDILGSEELSSYVESLIREYLAIMCLNHMPLDTVFRTVNMNAQPFSQFCDFLRLFGFRYDSSVYAGGFKSTQLTRYDYRSIDHGNGVLRFSCGV